MSSILNNIINFQFSNNFKVSSSILYSLYYHKVNDVYENYAPNVYGKVRRFLQMNKTNSYFILFSILNFRLTIYMILLYTLETKI